jgi:hypothetical protein
MKPERLELLAAYVDGTLPAPEREAFERSIHEDTELRAEFELQQRINQSLGRLFGEEPFAEATTLPATLPMTRAKPAGSFRIVKWTSLAAALMLAFIGAWYLTRPDPLLLPPQAVYEQMRRVDFHPVWKCKDDQEFVQTVQKRLGEGLLIHDTDGIKVVGWAYGGTYSGYPISKDSMILITKVDQDNVLVFIDRASADRTLKVPKGSGLHLFRELVGGLVLYEVTPRNQAVVLPIAKSA